MKTFSNPKETTTSNRHIAPDRPPLRAEKKPWWRSARPLCVLYSRSLKTRITIFTLIIFLFSLWSLAFYASKMLRKDVQTMLSDQQFSTASLVAAEINQELEDRIRSLEDIASYLSPYMQDTTASLQSLLEKRTVFQGLFNAGTFVTGFDGVAIASVPLSGERVGVNYSDKEYITAAMQERKTTISQPIIARRLKTPLFAITAPILDGQGKVLGAIVGSTDLSKPNFLDKIAQNNYGRTGGYLVIAPQHRLFITGTDKSFIMRPTPAPGSNPLLDRYMQGFEGSGVITDSQGVEMLLSAKHIPAAGWFVAARIPAGEAFAPIYAMQRRMLRMTVGMTLLAGSMTWLMLRRQLAPLLAAVNILSAQSNTSLPSPPLPLTQHDEIGALIGSFNRMLGQLARQEDALQENRQQLSNIIEFLPTATLAIDRKGQVIIWNKAIEKMTGIPAAEMIGKGDLAYTIPFYGQRRPVLADLILRGRDEEITALYPAIIRDGESLGSELYCSALFKSKGAWIFAKAAPLRNQEGVIIGAIESIRDISERKLSEIYGNMSREVLQILNEPGTIQDSVQRVLGIVKTRTGLDAVGIRLQDGDDFPYLAQEGFSHEFVLTENLLAVCTAEGEAYRNMNGNVRLEGLCGLVISGRTDPSNPLFTQGGSFWSNDAPLLLDIPADEDLRLHPRNHCIHQGYCSMALVPIRNQDRIIGLIQLNDTRRDRFTRGTVELLEGIASHLGAALMRKRAEEALRKSETRYAATLSVLETGLWDWHIPSGQATFSAVYYKILGYMNGEFPASYDAWRNLVHPDDLGVAEHRLTQGIEFGKGFALDLRMKMKSGEWKWVSKRGRPIEKDKNGRTLRMVGTLADITERKQAEEERKNMQAQLQQAQKMETIGTLAGGIAHDFNNILTAILGYAEMARGRSPRGSMVAKDIDQVLKAGHRAKELVKQILTFSRQNEAERIPLQPSQLIKEASKMLRSSLPTTIDIQLDIDQEAGTILADPTHIHQILMNLCTNAYHAMEETGGTLTISLKQEHHDLKVFAKNPKAQTQQCIRLSIADTGHGIAPEVQERIFEPYFTTKPVGKGTGMGLAIIHGIVQSYGGSVTCDSRPGEGTVFHIVLPTVENSVLQQEKIEEMPPRGDERILIVDDEVMLAEMSRVMLEGLGYRVTARTNSSDALATFQNRPDQFDLIITDQTMPGMTGADLARSILQIRPDMPIILCSGYSSLISEEQVRAIGIRDFAMKPVTRSEIAHKIRQVLDVC